jgi:hypothetical protein
MAALAPDYRQERRANPAERRLATVTSIARVPAASDGMRVSWAGVWGGVLAAVGLLMLMASLGVAIGVSTIDAARADAMTLGSAAGLWAAGSLLLALFVGGLVSTRAGAIHDRATSFWEGFLVWVVSMLLMAYLATSGLGSLTSGALQLMGAGGARAQATQPAAPAAQAGAGNVDPSTAVDQLRNSLQGAASGLQQRAAQVQPAASMAAWATFGALVMSLFAAVMGSAAGRRRYSPAVVR